MQDKVSLQTRKLTTLLSSFLLLMLAIFVLALTVKIGFDLAKVFEAAQVEAAGNSAGVLPSVPSVTPTPEAVVSTPDVPASTPLPPTSTPQPTSTPMPTPAPREPYLVAGESGVNVRTGPGLEYEKIGLLLPGSEAAIRGYSGDWWAVDINGEQGWVFGEIVTAFAVENVPELAAPPLPTPSPVAEETPLPVWAIDEQRWIDVDLSEQRLSAYEMQTPVKSYLVSTGLPQTPTPVGQYRIWIKLKTDDMAGADYYIKDVPWVMYFFEGYGFHGVTWHGNFGHPMSHGCVNQPTDMAEWLFHFAEVGTLVNVHE